MESGDIAPCILNLSAIQRQVVSFMAQPFYCQRKSPWYPLDNRLVGPRASLDAVAQRKKSLPLLGIEHQLSSL